MISSRALIVPLTEPESRALSAVIAPSMRLASPCTSEAQTRSPWTVPSTWRSAEASTSPLMTTSAPITENVALVLAIGFPLGCGAALGYVGSGFFENMRSGLQEGARIDRAVMYAHLEMQVRAGRSPGAAHQADHVAGGDALADTRAQGGQMGIPGHQPVAVADFDHPAVTRLGSHESNLSFGRGPARRADIAAEVEPRVHRGPAVERIA